MKHKKRRWVRARGRHHLLDALAYYGGCEYLSDLRLEKNRTGLLRALEKIYPRRYPRTEWLETLRYLLTRVP